VPTVVPAPNVAPSDGTCITDGAFSVRSSGDLSYDQLVMEASVASTSEKD
jgi:hypothetical protein